MRNKIAGNLLFLFCVDVFFAQIPNNGFENWTNMGTYTNPTSWSTLNNKTAAQGLFTATMGTPGSPGTAFLKLTSKTIAGSVVPGIAVCGKLDSMSLKPLSGYAFNQRPAYFGGKWQHMIYGSSQGWLTVLLSRWDSLQGKRDTIASGLTVLTGMDMSWTNFAFGLSYVDSLHYPDSCIIVMRASGNNPTNNDYLWVDNLSFSGTVAVVPPPPPPDLTGLEHITEQGPGFTLFPNPAHNEVTISFKTTVVGPATLQISNLNGCQVQLIDITPQLNRGQGIVFVIDQLSKGVYSMHLVSQGESEWRVFVVE